jgi:ABC-type lipoprotein release transport system permease subunit
VPFLVRVAWRNLWRHSRRSLITAGAMGLGVALCMFMISYSDGLYVKMFDILVSQKLGHAQLHHPDYPTKKQLHDTIQDGEALLTEIDALPGVKAATGRLQSFGLLASDETSTGGQLLGVVAAREEALARLSDNVEAGTFALGDNKTLVGKGLADTLKLEVGDELVAIVQAADGSMGNELFEVAGIFKTGSAALDRTGAFVALADLQRLTALEGQIHEVLVIGDDPEKSPELAGALRALPDAKNLLVRTWSEADPTAAQMMSLQDAGAFIMLFFVFSLASFGVLNTMLMSVFERTRELGVL